MPGTTIDTATANPFALHQLPGILHKPNKVEKEKSTLDIAKELEKQPVGLGSHPTLSQTVHPERPQITIQSQEKADAALKKMMHGGEVNPAIKDLSKDLGAQLTQALDPSKQELTPQELNQLVEQQIKKADPAAASPGLARDLTNREQVMADLKEAFKDSRDEFDQVKNQIATAPDHLENIKQTHQMAKGVDALHSACNVALTALEQSSRAIKMHLTDIEQRTQAIRDMLDLNDLMVKYEDRESVDLMKPKPAELQDFTRILELREVAKRNGIQWDSFAGWKSKKDHKRYTAGISALVGALQAQNKVKDLQLQQAVSVHQAYVLLCTNIIALASQLLRNILQNIRHQ